MHLDPNYGKVLVRLLAAHALAEKLTADGYQRALAETRDPELAEALQKNLSEERKHAVLIYRALAEIGAWGNHRFSRENATREAPR